MILRSVSSMLKLASVVPDDVYDRLQDREGGHTKVTKDQGGVTKGGIAESGGQFTADQIRKLTPDQIRNAYGPYWQSSGQHFQNPAAAEIAFDMSVNAGPPRTASIIQKTLNQMTPDLPPLPGNGNIGPQTKARMAIVDQSELGRRLYGAFGKHHAQLVADNPAKHGASAKGWANRRTKLSQAPEVGQILAGKNLPQVFKGIPPKGAVIVPPDPPVLVRPNVSPNGSPSRSSLLKSGSAPDNIAKLLSVLSKAKAIKRDLGSDAADRFTMGQVGSTLRAAIARSRNQAAPKAPAPAATGPLQQSQFPFMGKQGSIAAQLRRAFNETHQHPTEGQKECGNYRKGRVKLHGLNIAIENPPDSIRRGTSKDGKKWENRMPCAYGYFVGTEAVDGDAVDCFIGPDPESEFVLAIDQQDGRKFDETKFVLGCKTRAEAEKLYLSCYHKGWTLGPVSTTTTSQLKTWLKEGDTKKPFSGQLVKAAEQKEMSLLEAVLMGDPSGLSAAFHGYQHGGKDQAWRSGLTSAGGGVGGGMLGALIAALSRGKLSAPGALGIGSLLGSTGGAVHAANKFNEELRGRTGQMKSGYAVRFHENLKRALGQD